MNNKVLKLKRYILLLAINQPPLDLEFVKLPQPLINEIYDLGWSALFLRVIKARRRLYRLAGISDVESYCIRDLRKAIK